jgi:hypothetical protein
MILQFYIFLFIFWRLGYNLGLGLLLHKQSKDKFMTKWFEKIDTKNNPFRPLLITLLAKDMEDDYKYEVSIISSDLVRSTRSTRVFASLRESDAIY